MADPYRVLVLYRNDGDRATALEWAAESVTRAVPAGRDVILTVRKAVTAVELALLATADVFIQGEDPHG